MSPVDARTWSQFDMVTASRLDGDLYTVNGSAFLPNGVGFHARKPLYKATQASGGLSVNAGGWRGMFENEGASVLVDNSGYYGSLMDPNYGGTIADAVAYSNGNPNLPQGSSGSMIGGGGGWYLMSAVTPLNGSAGAMFRVSIADGWTGTTPNLVSTGTSCAGNASRDVAPWVADLVLTDGGAFSPVIYNGAGSNRAIRTTVDGSGETCLFNAQWMSVTTDWGHATGAGPAPVTNWASGTTVTAAGLNTGLRNVLRVLNMPPCLRVAQSTVQNIADSTDAVINLGTPQLDTYGAFSNGTNTYTVPFDGIYLCYAAVGFAASGGNIPSRAGIAVNGGTTMWGPISSMPAGNNNVTAKVHLLDLEAGDTVQMHGEQFSGSTNATASNIPSVLVLAWLGARAGFPASLPSPPDLSYRYTAGSSPARPAFNAHLANDLSFLTWKPYLLSRQTSSQSIPQNTGTQLLMDTITGSVHSTPGDPYSGWDAVHQRYVAPCSGWYLAVTESFFGTPSLTSTPSTVAQFQISANSGASSNWDWYGHQNLAVTNTPGGAAGLAWYYLRAGDWITPGVQTQDTASGSFSTSVSGSQKPHFECMWISS